MSQQQVEQPQQKKSMREVMSAAVYSGKEHFADVLSHVDPKHLMAQTRTVSPFATATLKLVSIASQRERHVVNEHQMRFDIKSVTGRMDYWQFYFDGYQISNDGKGRAETVEVLKLAAIGGADDSGAIALTQLQEGSKKLDKKGAK